MSRNITLTVSDCLLIVRHLRYSMLQLQPFKSVTVAYIIDCWYGMLIYYVGIQISLSTLHWRSIKAHLETDHLVIHLND